jgi:Protein of unknown function (DUF3570)
MKQIRERLYLATCSLLSHQLVQADVIDNAWKTDVSMLYYSEAERVDVNTLVGVATGVVASDDTATLRVVLDTMSGATPSGAVKKSSLTFTGASGGTGITPTGGSAALGQFNDTRVAVSLDWLHDYGRLIDLTYDAAFSVENDYRSFSGAIRMDEENSNRAYKFSAGISGTYDQVFRVGGNNTPVPLSRVSDQQFFGEGEKFSTDAILGVSHVINQRTLGQLNIGYSVVKGYLTDPYKVFSLTDAAGFEIEQYYEARPDSRRRFTLSANLNHQLYPENDVMHLQYRFYIDDWKISSNTLDYSLRHSYGEHEYLEPHLRLYNQTNAYFYQNSVITDPASSTPITDVIPQYTSADYRLDDMFDITIGMRYGKYTGSNGHFRARMEYLYQKFKHADFDTNKAIVLQLSYAKEF